MNLHLVERSLAIRELRTALRQARAELAALLADIAGAETLLSDLESDDPPRSDEVWARGKLLFVRPRGGERVEIAAEPIRRVEVQSRDVIVAMRGGR